MVLLGEFTGRRVPMIQALGWGRMWIARGRNIYVYPGEPWGFDNGAFRDWVAGTPFNAEAYRESLRRAVAQPHPPTLAVVPDVPGNGPATLRMAETWWPELQQTASHFPWFIAVQDGMEPGDLEPWADRIAGVFLGGTNEYKARANDWAAWCKTKGLRFHYGRAGTMEKVAHAMEVGADSIDSALPMWTEGRWRAFVAAIQSGPPQGDFFRESA
jgi:hypothetical protein